MSTATLQRNFSPSSRPRLSTSVEKRALSPVELRLDEAAAEIIPGTAATELDFDTEFLDYILAVAVVDDLDAAIAAASTYLRSFSSFSISSYV